MIRRSALTAFAVAGAFALGTLVPSRPPAASADAPPAQRKCVGVAAAQHMMGLVRVYRAFEDGTVEALDEGQHPTSERWKVVGK
jgi:hypothetical protein